MTQNLPRGISVTQGTGLKDVLRKSYQDSVFLFEMKPSADFCYVLPKTTCLFLRTRINPTRKATFSVLVIFYFYFCVLNMNRFLLLLVSSFLFSGGKQP